MDGTFSISENAAKRIAELSQKEQMDTPMLRVTVNSGGCYGLQYAFTFDGEKKDDDQTFEMAGAVVVMDDMSLNFLKGSQLDYVEDMMGAFFTIKNPNATSSCGCGSSFSV